MASTHDLSWPLYFAKRPLQAKRIALKRGDVFPIQSKSYVRGLAAAYGLSDADRVPFGSLDYVETVDVRTQETAVHVIERGLNVEQTRRLLSGGTADGR